LTTQTPEQVDTLPASWYCDPARWPLERAEIFAPSWQLIGHESEMARPGAWIADTIAGYPLLVVRSETGALNGFHNVCRHRAGPIATTRTGQCDGALVCAYHGWRYALDGRLREARDFGAAPGFDPRAFALFPVRVATWRGLVFVCQSPDAAPLADWLAPLDARLGDADWTNLRVALSRTHDLACNWKTYAENYLEGYHVPLIHPGLDAEIESDRYVVTMDGRIAFHDAPRRTPDAIYDGLWAWAWPNLGVNVYRRGLMMERISPMGPHATRLDYLYLTPDGEDVPAETLAMSDQVTAEDKAIVESVQINLAAGLYERGRLSPRHEGGVRAFQGFVAAALGGAG